MCIRLTIRLFGTLSSAVPDYDHKKGIVVDVPDGITPEWLLNGLQISLSNIGLISCENQVIQRNTLLTDGMTIHFFSLISGG
jgi:hypothetical protein